MKKLFFYPIILLSFLLILIQACSSDKAAGQKPEEEAQKAQAVRVTKLNIQKESNIPIVTSGILHAKTEARLSFKIGGVIRKIYVDEGQYFAPGQLLATLDQSEISSQVIQAESARDKAQRDLQRAKNLYTDTVATLEQVENAQTAYEMAQADLKIAQFNKKYAAIQAPSGGKVLQRFAEEGELVNPGTPILVIASTSDAQVIRVGLADRDIVRIKLGDRAQVSFDAYPREIFQALVSEIAETSDPNTGTYEVELSVQSKGKILKNGFVGKVSIFPSSDLTYYQIPMGALVEADKKQAYIYIPTADKRAKRVDVEVVHIEDNHFTVPQSTFPEGITEVISAGGSYLSDNDPIRVMKP